jgi:hypothetical protein
MKLSEHFTTGIYFYILLYMSQREDSVNLMIVFYENMITSFMKYYFQLCILSSFGFQKGLSLGVNQLFKIIKSSRIHFVFYFICPLTVSPKELQEAIAFILFCALC